MELDYQLKIMDEMVVQLEDDARNKELLESLMRCAHSIKGASRMVEAFAIVQIAHALEDVFVKAQKGGDILGRSQIDVLLTALDMIHFIAKHGDSELLKWNEFHRQELDELVARINAIAHSKTSPNIDEVTERDFAQRLDDEEQFLVKSNDDSRQLLQIDTTRINRILGYAGESLVESHRFSKTRLALSRYKKHNYQLVEQIDQLRSLIDKSASQEVIRSKLHQVATTASIVRQELAEHLTNLDNYDRRNTILSEKLYKELLNTRMRSFSALVQGWPRFVRDLGRRLGKEARIETSGLTTLVDREVLERINIPLKHIIQNAVDHGIEVAEEREKNGKPRVGTISVQVRHNAGQLYITIQDDGNGIDRENLERAIVKKGLAEKTQLASKSAAQIFDYLFEPGFTTREVVTDISGRGVGLDLVKETILNLNGRISIESELGRGTKFDMVLPLTISVMRVLMMQLGGELYGMPMARVHRVLSIPLNSVQKDIHFYIEWEGQRITLVHGNYAFRIPTAKIKNDGLLPVIVLNDNGSLYGWIAEGLLGENELSIQALDPLVGKIPGITAAAVRQDGMLVLIMDGNETINLIKNTLAQQSPDLCLNTLLKTGSKKKVLVVDRARSSRERLKRLLIAEQFEVEEDSSTEHCIQRLQDQRYDLLVFVLDEEDNLPVRLQDDARFQRLPILFVVDGPKPITNPKLPWRYLAKMDFQSELFTITANRLTQG